MTTLRTPEPALVTVTNAAYDTEQALPATLIVGEMASADGATSGNTPVYADIEHTVVVNDPRKWSKAQKASCLLYKRSV